jgi:two-component system, OmpR family, sensor histidine kinase KdpD
MVWPARLNELIAPAAATAAALAGAVLGGAIGIALVGVAVALGAIALTTARRERAEALAQAATAAAKEREAAVVAEAASALLAAPANVQAVSPRVERALADVGARLQMCHAPAPGPTETALPLRASGNSGWLYVDRDGPLSRSEAERLLGRITDLISAAQERRRTADTAAEAEAARQADLAKTSVMHAVAHDLRVPLEGLATVTATLADDELPQDERLRLADTLRRETVQLERMVDDLLDLSRIEAGATNPQPDWCDLTEVVANAVARVCSDRDDRAVHVNLPPDLPLVQVDRIQLERVFCNLIENAAKFSPASQPIEIRGISANGRVTIRVLDRGRGIPAAQQSQIFKAFVRGSGPETGSGLGLAICRGFVEANGGRIALQSGARDGSAFAVSFPTAAQPSAVG